MTEIAVTDTHALIWYALQRWKKLGSYARAFFELADSGKAAVYIPTVALVELVDADRRGSISLHGGAEAWVRGLLGSGSYFAADLTVEIVLKSQELYAISERTDRLITATAAHLGYPLITRDPQIADFAGLELLW